MEAVSKEVLRHQARLRASRCAMRSRWRRWRDGAGQINWGEPVENSGNARLEVRCPHEERIQDHLGSGRDDDAWVLLTFIEDIKRWQRQLSSRGGLSRSFRRGWRNNNLTARRRGRVDRVDDTLHDERLSARHQRFAPVSNRADDIGDQGRH